MNTLLVIIIIIIIIIIIVTFVYIPYCKVKLSYTAAVSASVTDHDNDAHFTSVITVPE